MTYLEIIILHCLHALLVYLSVALCLCVLCGHLSQPGVSWWLGCASAHYLHHGC